MPPRHLVPFSENARAAGVFIWAGLWRALAVAAIALLTGCAAMLVPQSEALREAPPEGLPARAEMEQVPFFPQTEYQCGPAALATVLAATGVKVVPDDLVSQVYIPERKGSLQVEMLAAARRNGRIAYQIAPRFEDLLREIAAGNPVIVLQNLGLGPVEIWHYAVAVGYDLDERELALRSGADRRRVLPFRVHEFVWRKSDYWAMVAMPPERVPATADESRWLAAVAAVERLGDARTAQVAYAAALQRWPDSGNAAIGLANAHYALGELGEAERVLRRLIDRSPDSPVALNNLAQTLSDLGRQSEALAFVERAARNPGPYESAIGETRALIRKRMGDSK
jgi:tetratricopeptide (TPR) repeat protein